MLPAELARFCPVVALFVYATVTNSPAGGGGGEGGGVLDWACGWPLIYRPKLSPQLGGVLPPVREAQQV